MDDDELLSEIEAQKLLMMAVATGGPRINEVNDEYIKRRRKLRENLRSRGLDDPNPYGDLWRWHAKWSSDLPSYASRRTYIAELYDPLLDRIQDRPAGEPLQTNAEPTGWAKVDRQLSGIRNALEESESEEDYQTVGLRCREALISLAQELHCPESHPTLDGTEPSETDAKRKLEAYLEAEHAGSAKKETRKLVRAALDFANTVQHRRTASFRDAALCAEATIMVVNTIAILVGRRDP